MWWLVCLLLAPSPSQSDVASWLGGYAAGPETIAFRWSDELERSLESAWGVDWRESIYLKEKTTDQ